MRTNQKLLQVLVACALASSLTAAADAAGDWLAYRVANGLPVDPQPSKPGELPTFTGPVSDTLLEPLPDAKGNGNGNGNGSSHCDGFFVEMAKSDGDAMGDSGSCR